MEVYVKHLFWAFGLFFSGVALIMMSWDLGAKWGRVRRDIVETWSCWHVILLFWQFFFFRVVSNFSLLTLSNTQRHSSNPWSVRFNLRLRVTLLFAARPLHRVLVFHWQQRLSSNQFFWSNPGHIRLSWLPQFANHALNLHHHPHPVSGFSSSQHTRPGYTIKDRVSIPRNNVGAVKQGL